VSDDDLLIVLAELHAHGMQLHVVNETMLSLRGDPDVVPIDLLVEVSHKRQRLSAFLNTHAAGGTHAELP
jgi:hypothetical protein